MRLTTKYHQLFGWLSTLLLLFVFIFQTTDAQVRVTEEKISIPTYLTNNPNPMPRFFEGRGHQGVQRRIYPYPYNDDLTKRKENKDYHIIHIENDYIDIGIMPNMGGRIYYARDKTNDYNFFYRNNVMKPSLIGMVGFWISGGMGWGFPHHHGPNTVEPMDYKIVNNSDGSVTTWIASTDRRHRMKVLIGYTVHPNSSLIDMTIQPMNNTPLSNSFLFWANPAVHADTTYQVIFPPSVQYVTYHSKVYMTTWPIADGMFNRYDFTNTDISLWKNTFVPSSYFSWDPQEDYFGGYNHGKEAGVAWLGNHHINPGMKYWADGNNPSGRQTNNGLTDDDGQYIELMAGMYTDNQPDYSWLQPYEGKYSKMTWFPIRGLGGLKYANRNGALNLEIKKDNTILLGVNTTSAQKNAKVVIKSKDQALLEKVINISPDSPYKVNLPANGKTEDDLTVILYSSSNEELLSYSPAEHHPPDEPKPEPLQALPAPEEIKTVEELYYAGLRLNQFYNPSVDPMPYYLEALKRDPDDYRVNTQLGILDLKGFRFEEAEKHLQNAVNRITANYTRAKDSEGLYYLGIAQRYLGKTDEAYDILYRATWNYGWHSPAYYQLAQIDCERGEYDKALEHIDRALSTNAHNLEFLSLKTIILRKLNDVDGAKTLASSIYNADLLNHHALNELSIISTLKGENGESSKYTDELSRVMRDEVQSYLELATRYGNSGFYQDAIDLLAKLENKGNTFPMLHYYLGFYHEKAGDLQTALKYYQTASTMPSTYCFPFRAESIPVLKSAMKMNSKDSKAPYYLGNLLYEHQPQNAIAYWEKSRDLDDSFYIVHRNLAVGYQEFLKDNTKALASMEEATKHNNDDPRLLMEMDQLFEITKTAPEKEYEFLKSRYATANKRGEVILRLATRTVETGKFDEAIKLLEQNEIIESEGAREGQDTYLNAHVLRGMEYLNASKYKEALSDFETALKYPIGLNGRPRYAQFNYLIGQTYELQGDKKKAAEYYNKTLENAIERGQDYVYYYYHGLALQKLNRSAEAKELFNKLLTDAKSNIEGSAFFTQFGRGQSKDARIATGHYLAGLGHLGLGNKEKAQEEFSTALKFYPNHIFSRTYLNSLASAQNKASIN